MLRVRISEVPYKEVITYHKHSCDLKERSRNASLG